MGKTMNQPLKIDYHAESDTLWLGNGLATPDGEDIAENITAFFDDDGRPNAVMIEHASQLLLDVLTSPNAVSKSKGSYQDESVRTSPKSKSRKVYLRYSYGKVSLPIHIRKLLLNRKPSRNRQQRIGLVRR